MRFLNQLTMKHIFTCKNLHAKCYLNENTAIITSMNLYDYSQTHNREIGIKVEKEGSDSELYNEIYQEMLSITEASEPFEYEVKKVDLDSQRETDKISTREYSKKEKYVGNKQVGYCIRCGAQMNLDPSRPLCQKCYPIWAKYSDRDYPEKYCHICGKESKQSYAKPVCISCYRKTNK